MKEQELDQLIDWLTSVRNKPRAYIMGAFPWGVVGGPLEKSDGPNEWQCWVLRLIEEGLLAGMSVQEALAMATRIAVASGHGIGKSTLVAWIVKWATDTAPDTRGVVTANTETQLKTKTWAELGKWHNMSITVDMFTVTATAYFSKDPSRERTWRIDAIPWSEKNPEAFAGLHNKGRRLLLIMDEASAILDIIWETAEGAMTDMDTEIIWLAFGNPTRNTGRFRECFEGGRFAKYWNHRNVDSRTVPQTNKTQIAQWAEAYGEDSDFFKIRVKGEFPNLGEMEFFSAAAVDEAAARYVEGHGPLALGADVARFGKASSVIFPRRGRDAKTLPRKRYQGLSTVQFADKIAEEAQELGANGIMVDGTGVGGGVVDNIRQKAIHCFEIQFGAKDDTPHHVWGSQGEKYANKRSGMFGAARAWLRTGSIPNDPGFILQLKSIKYQINKRDEIQLLAKEDLLKDNPDLDAEGLDDADAFVLTFAHALAPQDIPYTDELRGPLVQSEYDPVSAFEKELSA